MTKAFWTKVGGKTTWRWIGGGGLSEIFARKGGGSTEETCIGGNSGTVVTASVIGAGASLKANPADGAR